MLIAVDASVPCSVVSSPSNLEVVTVKIGFNPPLFLCTVYVPPIVLVMAIRFLWWAIFLSYFLNLNT